MCNCKVPHSVRDRRDKQKADTLNLLKAQVKQCLLPHMPTCPHQQIKEGHILMLYQFIFNLPINMKLLV